MSSRSKAANREQNTESTWLNWLQLFASQYMDFLPTEKELADEIERQKEILKLNVSKYTDENE